MPDVESVLRGWRQQAAYEAASSPASPPRSCDYVPLLAAALDAVLKLAGDFESATTPIGLYDRVAAGRAIREAITRELTGEETPDGQR